MPTYYKTVIKDSGVAGKGIFADEDIPKGAIWWRAHSDLSPVKLSKPNIAYTQQMMAEYEATHSVEEMRNIVHHSLHFVEGNLLLYINDDDNKWMNHSFEPNSQVMLNKAGDWKLLYSYALKDIKAGEEIVENYITCPKKTGGWVEEIIKKYDPDRILLEVQLGIKENPNKILLEDQQ